MCEEECAEARLPERFALVRAIEVLRSKNHLHPPGVANQLIRSVLDQFVELAATVPAGENGAFLIRVLLNEFTRCSVGLEGLLGVALDRSAEVAARPLPLGLLSLVSHRSI
jgi:hypothetical protein